METIKYIILGILQGVTEPIPVSSSGHLVIFRRLIDENFFSDLNFEIIVNFGSLLAILFFFRKDIADISRDFFVYLKNKDSKHKHNFDYVWLLVVGTIPAALFGLTVKDIIELNLTNIKFIGGALIITASFLYIIRNIKGTKDDNMITLKDALVIGLFQVAALLPGISRSGATIVGGMLSDLKREAAFRFSFLLFIPISLAAMVVGINDFLNLDDFNSLIVPYTLGMIVSAIATYYALGWFRDIVKKGKLIYFVYYCLIVGILVLLFM